MLVGEPTGPVPYAPGRGRVARHHTGFQRRPGRAISDNGIIVGASADALVCNPQLGFRRLDALVTGLGSDRLFNARGVNDDGQITGQMTPTTGPSLACILTPTGTLRWDGGSIGRFTGAAQWDSGAGLMSGKLQLRADAARRFRHRRLVAQASSNPV